MDAIFSDGEFWQAVGYAIGALIALLAAAVVARYSAKFWRDAWLELRGHVPVALKAIDEPDDPLILLLDRYLPGKNDVALAAFLSAGLRALADALDRQLDVPPEENLGDTAPR